MFKRLVKSKNNLHKVGLQTKMKIPQISPFVRFKQIFKMNMSIKLLIWKK